MSLHTSPGLPRRRTLCALAAAFACAGLPLTAAHAQATPAAAISPYTTGTLGWAAGTTGGQGGRIVRVTTLAASGPGSLAEAVAQRGARTVVFEVGGEIDLAGATLKIAHGDLTLAGQTAPSPGITVVRAEVQINASNVVVQHLRFRPGEYGRPKKGGGDHDGISTVGPVSRVLVDHCSFSWATDENLSASGPRFTGSTPEQWRAGTSHQITYSHNLIYESLSNSVHEKGEHSKGSLIHDNARGILLYRNVYASNRERNALFKGGTQGAMVNNLIFNPGRVAVHYNLLENEWQGQPWQRGELALVGNVYRMGPDTEPGTALFTLRGQGPVALHLADNLAFDRAGRPAPQVENKRLGPQAQITEVAQAGLPADVAVLPAAQLEAALWSAVGARPWDRDALDARLVADVQAGRGRIIDDEGQNPLGGFLRPAPTRRAFREADWNLADMSPAGGWSRIAELTRPQ